MKVEVVVCNVCEDVNLPTSHFRISNEETDAELDLCVGHSQHLLALMDAATVSSGTAPRKASTSTRKTAKRTRKAATPTAPRKTGVSRVVSLEDIEKLKK